jgi:superfamily II DNA or RNA helicase
MDLTTKKFKDIKFPETYKYSSDSEHIPLEFYEEVFPVAKNIDLLLGYFSSNAFKILSRSFSEFVINGGYIRIITNHVMTIRDKENLIENTNLKDEDRVIDIFQDVDKLESELRDYGQHFFDCLKYLLKEKRLQILPVKFNGVDLAHCKKMVLYDGENYISTDGSINFTLSALTKNSESFEVNAPWKGEIFAKRTELERLNFDKIFSKEHPNYTYLNPDQIETVITKVGKSKDVQDLLEDSIRLDESDFSQKVKEILNRKKKVIETKIHQESTKNDRPRFPYISGPRPYQEEAYNNWVKRNYNGVFAMATGTGKTITSLNCVLNEYKKSNKYHALILVPSIALLNQWEKEVALFNFKNVIKIGGGNNWEKTIGTIVSDNLWGKKEDYILISTYGSFVTDRFQKYFERIQNDLILIADEAHNIGANNIKKLLPNVTVKKRIGLSATPKRVYDEAGTDALNLFFKDEPPYSYEFSMAKALEDGFLAEYKYFPVIVELKSTEMEQYVEISKKLLRYFDFDTGHFKKDPMVEILLLKRKNIIHKAANKIEVFKQILTSLRKQNKLRFIFTYIPEGFVYDEEGNGEKLLNNFIKAGAETIPELTMNSYTSEDSNLDEILRGFSEGKIDLLFAMKMLDEGVDVPRAEIGIFCSSTGNPRQFIQRRGRLLRKHEDKAFATIYDMIVIPNETGKIDDYYNMEKNLVKNELQRVAYFASLSLNYYDTRLSLDSICKKYELNLDQIISEL